MIDRLLAFSLRNRALVLIATVLVIGLGARALQQISIDAFPDVTNVQVQVICEAPGRSPVEVEKFVTFPVEVAMSGLPRFTELRSLSKSGLSMVTVVFEDEVDIYFARQLVLERLIEAKEKLPEGVESSLGPVSTALGEIYRYTLEPPAAGPLSQAQLIELRTLQDWTVRPLLKTVPGVTDVNSFGGFVKQYQVLVDPDQLFKYQVSLREVFEAIAANNANAGGGVLEHGAEQYLVRGLGLIQGQEDIENIVVAEREGVPIYVRHLAQVEVGPEVRQGAAVKNGQGEAVAGIVLMLRGSSGREVVERVKEKVTQINDQGILPGGLKIQPFYDRSELVEACIGTVTSALAEGAVLVIAVLFLFLGNVRSALIVTLTLPLAMLFTFIVMQQVGLSANLMSLGGLAVAIGMMVDGSVVMVENIYRLLSERRQEHLSKVALVLDASREVAQPLVFGILIIILVFLPLFTLEGLEGKMFSPLAFTIAIALLGSLLLALTLAPVLCASFLKAGPEHDSFPVRWAKRIYLPALRWSLRRRWRLTAGAVALLLGSLAFFPLLGTEFIPTLDEGSLAPQVIRLPSISLTQSIQIEKIVQQALMEFPEVEAVVSNIGTAEIAMDPMGPNVSDPIVVLKPRSQWQTAQTKEELIEAMRQRLEKIPGVVFNISQPIALRVDELISGVKSQIAVELFGEDLDLLKAKGDEIAQVVSQVRGVADLRAEQVAGQPYLTVEIDRQQIARHGINVADVQEIIETAVGGKVATEAFEGERRFGVLVRFSEERRSDLERIGNILVNAPDGTRLPLAQLAKLSIEEGPVQISREDAKRRIVVECNVEDRDIGSFVAEAQQQIRARVDLPPGYFLTWGGAFENQQRAMNRLALIVPLTIGLIFFLLFSSFNSLRQAGLIILNLPFALIGGLIGLFISGQYLSVPASVGFIALFGVAVLNGIVLVSYFNKLRQEGQSLEEAVLHGCELRLRPVLMTALVAALGLIPLLFATGPGSEIQRPLATVVVGGLVTSTLLTLLLLPTLYAWFEQPKPEAEL
ncbi:MAG: efflux RND transporter permease subunit [Candidatus Latescibacteria bacterium]|nr:efflux RND transporter permease subunit [Candidatus Latescibacterota bacterium]